VSSGASPLLALCSATRTASVALIVDGEVSHEHAAVTSRHQSESLLPLVDRVLRESQTRVEDLGGYGISIGPGSFTSLRIGLSTLKGLSFGTKTPVAPISTLWALAAAHGHQAAPGVPIIAMLNAQRGEVYAAAFASDGAGVEPLAELLPELVYDSDELAAVLPTNCLLCGDGGAVVAEDLLERLGPGIELAGAPIEPSAGVVGLLAEVVFDRGPGVDAAGLAPRYVRRAEAEVTRTSERFESPAS
jgi:tRNA threonylcarbamoyladenosine biosynthesis protein TsaB